MVEKSVPAAEGISYIIFFFFAMLITIGIAFFFKLFFLEKEEKFKIPTKYLLSVLGIYLFYHIVLYLLAKLLSLRLVTFTVNNAVSVTILINLFYDLAVVGSIATYIFLKKNRNITFNILKKSDKSFFSDATWGVLWWLIAYPCANFVSAFFNMLVAQLYNYRLPLQLPVELVKTAYGQMHLFIILVVLIVVIAPILEEFIFRGIFYNFFKKYLNRYVAMIFSSIIFSFLHYHPLQGPSNLPILSSLFVLGFFLAFLYEKRQSLISPIFLHATINAISILTIIYKGV